MTEQERIEEEEIFTDLSMPTSKKSIQRSILETLEKGESFVGTITNKGKKFKYVKVFLDEKLGEENYSIENLGMEEGSETKVKYKFIPIKNKEV